MRKLGLSPCRGRPGGSLCYDTSPMVARGVILVSQSLGSMGGPSLHLLGWAKGINPAFFPPSRTVSSNTTITDLINLSPIILRQRVRDRRASQDPSFVTESPKNPSPGRYNFLLIPPTHETRIAIFNTTSLQNRNTNPLVHNTNSFSMQNDHDITVTDDRAEILTWLSPLEPHLRHHEIRTNRVKGVGDWLLRTEEFRSWRSGDGQGGSRKATIFCSGKLGVGKTYIR